MAYFNFKSNSNSTGSRLRFTSPDLVNPLYKPKTLAELKAEMSHTGINPAPIALRSPLPEIEGLDNIDAPPVCVGGDVFENIRLSREMQSRFESTSQKLKDLQDRLKQSYDESSKDKFPE